MKILMITPDALMIDRRIILEGKSLVEAGHDVTLLAGFECKEAVVYKEQGIEIHRYIYDWTDERIRNILPKLPPARWIRWAFATGFRYFAAIFLRMNSFERFMYQKLMDFNADVIQVHDLPCLKVGALAAHKKGIPLFYDAHEIYYSQNVLTPKQQKRLYKTEKKYIKWVSEAFTVNQFIAELMAERYNISPPHILLNATERPPKEAGADILRKEAGLPAEEKVVLYQGWISSERNIDKLIESVALWPQGISLVLIGYGAHVPALQKICQEQNIVGKVYFFGEKKNSELAAYTRHADLGVIPYEPIDENHLYCSPNKMFEFVVCGLPFICNRLPFFEYIQKTFGVLEHCEMGNPHSISQTIEQIMQDTRRLNLLKANCLKAAEELNWDKEGQKLVDVYTKYDEKERL